MANASKVYGTLRNAVLGAVSLASAAGAFGASTVASADPYDAPKTEVFASSNRIANLVFPEGITAINGKLFVSTWNLINPSLSRVLVFDLSSGQETREIGGNPGEELIAQGPLLGLLADKRTGDLYVAGNATGQVYRIQDPGSRHPRVSVYAQIHLAGAGPEAMTFAQDGTLYLSDSNLGLIYSIPPGGNSYQIEVGPAGSGARKSDNGLLQSPVEGLSPNGISFSPDFKKFYALNTYNDSIVVFDVNNSGKISSNARLLAQYTNTDLEENPTGFEVLITPNTRIGFSASTPLNGPDGIAFDEDGNIWSASILGDNLTCIDPVDGHVIRTLGSSSVSSKGLLNMPSSLTFVGKEIYNTNLGLFTDGTNGNPLQPWVVTRSFSGVNGYNGNGNQ